MKITNLSLAAIAAVAMTTGAMAGDGVDFKIGGQAVVYYQTIDGGDNDMFNQDGAKATAALQLNLSSDLGNGFGMGLQGTALNTFGLEKNLVAKTMQQGSGDLANADDYIAMTKAYLTKQVANTTLKMGRQELPKSLSPLAFSENWNATKNTFDAIVAINSDLPDTTLVGAYVSRTNGNGFGNDMSTYTDLIPSKPDENGTVVGSAKKGAYMLTAANKSVANVPITLSYYQLPSTNLSAVWADVQANKLGPVNVGLQGGSIMNGAAGAEDSQAVGAKVSGKFSGINATLAYSKVSVDGVGIQNVGTMNKTPLYTQMVANQGAIKSGNDTVLLKAVMPAGPGKLITQYGMTTDNSAAANDYNELDLIYKFKALGTNMLAAYVMQNTDKKTLANNTDDTNNIIRIWSRYNF